MTLTKQAVQPATVIWTNPEINKIKEKMSKAYLHGVNTTVNYSIQEASSDFDGLGIDFQIVNKSVGTTRKVASEANQINIQLKGVSLNSSTMLRTTASGVLQYNLAQDLYQIAGVLYLVVVVLPSDEEIHTWRSIDASRLILNAKAYYTPVNGVLKKGWLDLLDARLLTEESYIALFEMAKDKNAI